jgi:hypothetical protein
MTNAAPQVPEDREAPGNADITSSPAVAASSDINCDSKLP